MNDLIFDNFQNTVASSLLRHKSILDILSKYQDSQSRVNRAICKAVTSCGCIKINASKQDFCSTDSITELRECLNSHLTGSLCDNCRAVIENELGNNLFYLTSLCETLDINLFDILVKETEKMNTLGEFTFR
ncbi:MAG: DUF1573 domain-containing protein [Sarcina sp.]